MTVLENVALAIRPAPATPSALAARPSGAALVLSRPCSYLERVGLGGQSDRRAGAMSHGEHRQLEIAMALATEPALLLLDEPMAGMGSDESARMLELIARLRRDHSVLLIEARYGRDLRWRTDYSDGLRPFDPCRHAGSDP